MILALLAETASEAEATVTAAVQQASAAVAATGLDPFIAGLTVFALAVFVGFEIITKIPPTLHTPLMSGSNAISGITVVGAILAAGEHQHDLASYLGFLAIVMATVNVVGGFLVTHRMLQKFKR
jgi:NAD(P) transhydrogenase subunit alpha